MVPECIVVPNSQPILDLMWRFFTVMVMIVWCAVLLCTDMCSVTNGSAKSPVNIALMKT